MLIFAGITIAASYWTGYVHGSSVLTRNEMFISLTLPAILIWTLAKLTIGFFFRRDSLPQLSGGSQPPLEPPAGVPAPRPPGAPPVIYCRHAA